MTATQPRILFVQPSCQPPGGANGVAAWMLQVLVQVGNVTVMSWEEFEPKAIDSYYGTSLAGADIQGRLYSNWLRILPLPTALAEFHLFLRAAKREAQHYDLVFSACDEVDFGRPGVEYIHYPWNAWPRPDAPADWAGKRWLSRLVAVYNRCCALLSGFRWRGRENLSLVNSEWTGRLYQSLYPDVRPCVLYPPALGKRVEFQEELRESRFLNIGRLVPSKELEKLVAIVARLRECGHEVGLTLVGGRQDLEYESKIRALIARHSWAELITDPTREQILNLMATHRYGLHGMRDEHYGMAVAELVLGGCLTMVPDDGGQVEIVEDHRLQYGGVEEAVQKLDLILRDSDLESELREAQAEKSVQLTRERFCQEFRALVPSS